MTDFLIRGTQLWNQLKTLPQDKHPAVIFNSHITGLAISRALGKKGIPIIALDRDGRAVGLQSKYVHTAALCPNPFTEEAEFISLLLEIGRNLPQKGVLFPCNDEWVLLVSKHRTELEKYFLFPFAEWDNVESLLNKRKLYKKAASLDIPIPATWYPEEFSGEYPDDLPFPCIVKPVEQRSFYEAFQTKAFTANSTEELTGILAKTASHEVVIQDIISSSLSDFYSLCTYTSMDGEIKGQFTGRKLEQYPLNFGTGCLVESAEGGRFVSYGAEILKAQGYYGIAETEFVYDKRDDTYKLLDVNTRVWKWIGLPIFSGVNLPLLAYNEVTGLKGESQYPVLDYSKWVYFDDYLKVKQERPGTFHGHLSDSEMASVLFGETSTHITEAVFSAEDRAPSVQQVKNKFNQGYICPC
ncbi:hypothetical protein J9317_01410 [Metabacillus sp. KIGAM252]|uniref:ATP-grasp domain-containing protein n=1 Tax=Metabacillus flavus TaxID=2823519 RepID=A0ABS5L9P8_9BACI|nr:hypothetical protein [Metabacillus flavus]MBS2967449.1 hypothetical protein [Metabacillus flavus]